MVSISEAIVKTHWPKGWVQFKKINLQNPFFQESFCMKIPRKQNWNDRKNKQQNKTTTQRKNKSICYFVVRFQISLYLHNLFWNKAVILPRWKIEIEIPSSSKIFLSEFWIALFQEYWFSEGVSRHTYSHHSRSNWNDVLCIRPSLRQDAHCLAKKWGSDTLFGC